MFFPEIQALHAECKGILSSVLNKEKSHSLFEKSNNTTNELAQAIFLRIAPITEITDEMKRELFTYTDLFEELALLLQEIEEIDIDSDRIIKAKNYLFGSSAEPSETFKSFIHLNKKIIRIFTDSIVLLDEKNIKQQTGHSDEIIIDEVKFKYTGSKFDQKISEIGDMPRAITLFDSIIPSKKEDESLYYEEHIPEDSAIINLDNEMIFDGHIFPFDREFHKNCPLSFDDFGNMEIRNAPSLDYNDKTQDTKQNETSKESPLSSASEEMCKMYPSITRAGMDGVDDGEIEFITVTETPKLRFSKNR